MLVLFFLFISLEVTPSPKEQPPTFPLVSVADKDVNGHLLPCTLNFLLFYYSLVGGTVSL